MLYYKRFDVYLSVRDPSKSRIDHLREMLLRFIDRGAEGKGENEGGRASGARVQTNRSKNGLPSKNFGYILSATFTKKKGIV